MASQKGPLWWAAHHRNHHRFSDTDRDVHSPKRGLLVEPRRLDPLRQVQPGRPQPDPRLREVPGVALHRQARLDRAVDARRRLLPDRRLERPRHRVLRVDGAALARHVHGQLGRARVGPPARTRPTTPAATRCSSRSRPAARAGTTTTTATRGRPARDSAGGRSTRRTTCCACCSWVGIVPRPAARARAGHRRSARRQGSTSSFGYFSVVASTSASVHTG